MGDYNFAGARRGANQLCLPGLSLLSHSDMALIMHDGGCKSLFSPAKSGGRGMVPNRKPCAVSHGQSQEAGRGKAQHKPAAAPRGGRGGGAAHHQSHPPPRIASAAVVKSATKQLAVTKVSQFQQKEQKNQLLQTARQNHGGHVPMQRRDHVHQSAASSSKTTRVVTTKIIEKHTSTVESRTNNRAMVGIK